MRINPKKIIGGLALFFIVFIYIYQPPIVPKIIYPAAQLLFLALFVLLRPKTYWLMLSKFKTETAIIFILVLWSMLRDAATGEVVYADRFLVWWFQAFMAGPAIAYIFLKYREADNAHFPKIVFNTGLIAALITASLYLSPSFDNFYKSIQLDSYYEIYENFDERYRAYGASENLTFTYGYILGMLAGYAFLKTRSNIYYLGPTLLFLLGVALNARIGFLPFIIISIYGILTARDTKSIIRLLFVILVPALIYYHFSDQIEQRSGWALAFFKEISGLVFPDLSENQSRTIYTLLGDFIVWPESVSEWFFGTGQSLFLDRTKNSDVGYILQLNYAGIFFLFFIVIFLAYTSWRVFHNSDGAYWFPIVFTFSIFFLNFKGFLFAATPGGRLLFALYIFYVLKNNRNVLWAIDGKKRFSELSP